MFEDFHLINVSAAIGEVDFELSFIGAKT